MTCDYSQSGEQAAILAWAADRKPAMFLDLGAGDGETYSNTRALWLADWAGVCVEPAAWAFDKLSKLYAGTQVECVQAVVTADTTGLVGFHYTRDDHLSSTEAAQTAKWVDATFEPVTVAAVKLSELLQRFGGFGLVSIDTEGTSLELLHAYRAHPAWDTVECVCVEVENGLQSAQVSMLLPGWRRLAVTANNVVLCRS